MLVGAAGDGSVVKITRLPPMWPKLCVTHELSLLVLYWISAPSGFSLQNIFRLLRLGSFPLAIKDIPKFENIYENLPPSNVFG